MISELKIPGSIPPHGTSKVLSTGADHRSAAGAMIMIHGRGATAEEILGLSAYFDQKHIMYLAPQASGNIWYPYSFLSPVENNEPGLSSALDRISDIMKYLQSNGIPENKVMILGFSQGACLALEWSARNAHNLSAVFGLSGGLIGSTIEKNKYAGTLQNSVVFLGCSDVDFHIPKDRVIESAQTFESMQAKVTVKLYSNLGHSINQDEIDFISDHIDHSVLNQ